MTEPIRVSFEFTPDELADVTLRWVTRSDTYRVHRRQFRRTIAICLLVGTAFAAFVKETPTPEKAGFMALVGVALGTAWYLFAGKLFDVRVRARVRRLVMEQVRAHPALSTEVELREGGLRLQQMGHDETYAWKDFEAIVDGSEGLVLISPRTYMVLRARAFATPEERQRFLKRARELAHAAGATPRASL